MKVFGKNVAREILNSNYNIKSVYLVDNFNNEEILSLIDKKHIKPIVKTNREMDKMTKELHQGIIIDLEDYKYHNFNDIKNDLESNFIVILDQDRKSVV